MTDTQNSASTHALKFLKEGAIGPYSGFRWPVPNGKPDHAAFDHAAGIVRRALRGTTP